MVSEGQIILTVLGLIIEWLAIPLSFWSELTMDYKTWYASHITEDNRNSQIYERARKKATRILLILAIGMGLQGIALFI